MNKKSEKDSEGLITLNMFLKLAGVQGGNCISIYLPTSRAGEKVISQHAQKKLKNIIKDTGLKLSERGMAEKEFAPLLKAAKELLEDDDFWRHQSDGLALFINGEGMRRFTLPVHFEEKVYISDHFYLLPLFPFFNNDGEFYLLSLSQNEVKLYECSKNFITEIVIEDLIPGSLKDAAGHDFEEKSLQYRTGHGSYDGAMYHGQGRSKDHDRDEIVKYFRAIDNGLMKLLANGKKPMVLACVESHYPVYRQISAYPDIYDEYISGNPDNEDPLVLHQEAWLLLKNHFRKKRENKTALFRELQGSDKTDVDLNGIIRKSADGRTDTLFIQGGKDKYGTYEPENRTAEISGSEQKPGEKSLYNLAAIYTLLNGGWVYIMTGDNMPAGNTEINAILRY